MIKSMAGLPSTLDLPITNNNYYTCRSGWRETLRVKCLAQEHNTMPHARARTQTAQCRGKCTIHEATVPHVTETREKARSDVPLGLNADLTFRLSWYRADVWSEDCCDWQQSTQGWERCHHHEPQMSPGLVVLLECCGSIRRAKTWKDYNETWTETFAWPRWVMR